MRKFSEVGNHSGGVGSYGGPPAAAGSPPVVPASFGSMPMGTPALGGVAARNPLPGSVSPTGYQLISSSCSDQDWVRLVTGNLMRQVAIVNAPTVGPDLDLVLFYNAQSDEAGPLGKKWRHNWQMSLEVETLASHGEQAKNP